MNKRPYVQFSIAGLEATFKDNQDNLKTIDALLYELHFRSTRRASALKHQVLSAQQACPKKNIHAATLSSDTHKVRQQTSNANEPFHLESITTPSTSGTIAKPPVTNNPDNILQTWTALEVLAPQGYRREADLVAGVQARIARFDGAPLPWETGERSIPKKRLYYEVILGAIELGPALDSLLALYADNRPDAPSMGGYCPIASIILDKEGRPLEEDSTIAFSSFAWGVPVALRGDLKNLADWPLHEKTLKSSFKTHLIKRTDDNEIRPLNKEHLEGLFNYIVETWHLKDHQTRTPYFALRRYEHIASKTPPEPSLLNSFFLEDIALARSLAKEGAIPHALKHYLGISIPYQRTNLLEDNEGLQTLLQPALTPLSKWPGQGRFPLALLQQAAVNATSTDTLSTGILAVNGPPGTGKTTLLRDVVAARILERAEKLSEYITPITAFTPTSQSFQRRGAKITLHKLDERLKGFEMVVASSNNKAVENVSTEFPAMNSIAADAMGLRYFKSISDNVLDCDTWGIIAAALGNSSNCYNFSLEFWKNEEAGLSAYLNHVCGIPQYVSEFQEDGSSIKRPRTVIQQEQPPANAHEALLRWEIARTSFCNSLQRSKTQQAHLQELYERLSHLAEVNTELLGLNSEQPRLEENILKLKNDLFSSQKVFGNAEDEVIANRIEEKEHRDKRPNFLARLFRTARFKHWRTNHQDILTTLEQSELHLSSCRDEINKLQVSFDALQNRLAHLLQKSEELTDEQRQLEELVNRSQTELDVLIPDTDFFQITHEDRQMANVWFSQATNAVRDTVFEEALKLHRAFIDCAADPLRQNLSIFVESFGTRSLGTPEKDALIHELWASFFLVVPVVSTTFASVHRMFSRLGTEALGWLLVDEAGQAVPQAVVGAMMRTKHSVVVGDPLQIEPVVTLPSRLTEEICAFFGVDSLKYNAPEASVQTLADAASRYCARFPSGSGYRNVGAPLLVHRRCDYPMFEISNEIAYSNLMVQAKRASLPNSILGPSAWIDVIGQPGPDKWCADEANALLEMLHRLRAGGHEPDLYIVTPFVIVQNNLRQTLLKSGVLHNWVNNPNAWVREHVGTVHTVQGREARIVFFVLGAQSSSQAGARAWAGGKPNLVNVAVTRAKSSLYVIGNRTLWKSSGVFSTLDRHLPLKQFPNDFR